MSEILARIRVKEEHGIRRFLYPLRAEITLPGDVFPSQMHRIALIRSDETPVPLLITLASGRHDEPQRLDFAVSLAPYAQEELRLTLSEGPMLVDDPLSFVPSIEHQGNHSTQRHFSLTLDYQGAIRDVIYGGVNHLRGPSTILRNGTAMTIRDFQNLTGEELLAAWMEVEGYYADGSQAFIRTELSACKSWATVTHKIDGLAQGGEIVFDLPMSASSDPLTCDFGVGGGTFGKLEQGKAEEIVWRTEFVGDMARWSLATAGRMDYAGQTPLDDFHAQQWFHLIDGDKALAVAITEIPASCREMVVSLNTAGDVVITFHLGEPAEAVELGVCYHFLNDIPAIAAATNPQSILLPPTVEVLPVSP